MMKYSLGLDVSNKDIHCCISAIDIYQNVTVKASREILNTQKGFRDLDDWIKRNHKQTTIPFVICMEATGVYYENCAMYLHKAGYNVSVTLPNKAKKYLQASVQKSKNDKIGAKGLAQMGAEKSLRLWEPMGEYFCQLRELTRHDQSLQEMKTVISNRLHATERGMYVNQDVVKQLRSQLRLLEKQLEVFGKLIDMHITSNDEVCVKVTKFLQLKDYESGL